MTDGTTPEPPEGDDLPPITDPTAGAPSNAPTSPPGGPSAGSPTDPPAGPPIGPPVADDAPTAIDLTDEARVSSANAPGRLVAAAVGLLLLVGGGAFAFSQLTGNDGPQSPEAAVRELFDALDNEDALGAMATLEPGEQRVIEGPMVEMFEHMQRLEVLSSDFDLGSVSGLDFEVADLELRTEQVRDDLARVYPAGGSITSSVEGSALPTGAFVNDMLDRFEVDLAEVSESDTEQIRDSGGFIAAVQRDGAWRISLGYTLAEQARLDVGAPVVARDGGIEPAGADTPEAALENMIRATADFDLQRMIATLSPDEWQALQEYAPLFVDDAAEEMALAREFATIDIRSIDIRSDVDGDRARATLHGIDVVVTVSPDGPGGEPFEIGFTWADSCVQVSIPDELQEEIRTQSGDLESVLGAEAAQVVETFLAGGELCQDELEALNTQTGEVAGNPFGALFGPMDFTAPELDPIELGVTVTRTDGQWFVAPIGTGLDSWNAVLAAMDREDLDAFVEMGEQLFSGFAGAFGSSAEEQFMEIGEAIGPPDGVAGEIGVIRPDDGEFPEDVAFPDFEVYDEWTREVAPDDFEAQSCLFQGFFEDFTFEEQAAITDALATDTEPQDAALAERFRLLVAGCLGR